MIENIYLVSITTNIDEEESTTGMKAFSNESKAEEFLNSEYKKDLESKSIFDTSLSDKFAKIGYYDDDMQTAVLINYEINELKVN